MQCDPHDKQMPQGLIPGQFAKQQIEVEAVDTTQESIESRSIEGLQKSLFVNQAQTEDPLTVTLMNSSTTQESKQSSFFSSVLSPPRENCKDYQNKQPIVGRT